MFCRKCGEQIPENSEFCPVCGENQGITMKTEEAEKDGNGGVGKTVGKILGMVVGSAVTLISSVVVPIVSEEVGKGLKKTVKKETSNLLKKAGLKRKRLLMWRVKQLKQCRRKWGNRDGGV